MKEVRTSIRRLAISDAGFDEFVRRLRDQGQGAVADRLIEKGTIEADGKQVVADLIRAWMNESGAHALDDEIMRLEEELRRDIAG
jgi:hypothetical protein